LATIWKRLLGTSSNLFVIHLAHCQMMFRAAGETLMSLLEIQNLKVHFRVKHGMFSRAREFCIAKG
jgi:hypothetical protein